MHHGLLFCDSEPEPDHPIPIGNAILERKAASSKQIVNSWLTPAPFPP